MALKTRFVRSAESLNQHAHSLPALNCVDKVFVQNQTGPHPNKWDRSGVVVDCKDFDQYLIKLAGTGRLFLRNRRFLRRFTLPGNSSGAHVNDTNTLAGSHCQRSHFLLIILFLVIVTSPLKQKPQELLTNAQ